MHLLQAAAAARASIPTLAISDQRVGYLPSTPIGVEATPRFSWRLAGPSHQEARGLHAVAYRLRVGTDDKLALWDTGRVAISNATISTAAVSYAGPPLSSDTDYFWAVEAWLSDGATIAAPSPPRASFRTGLLVPSDDWTASWITGGASRLLRTEFNLPADYNGTQQRATLFVSGLGYQEVLLNGQKVADHYLDQAWTTYARRAYYSSFNVAPLLRAGTNAVGVMLGTGWFAPPYIPKAAPPQLRLQLQVDGKVVCMSDPSWRVGASPGVPSVARPPD